LDERDGRLLARPVRRTRRSAQEDGPMSKPATGARSAIAKRTSTTSAKVAAKLAPAKASKPRKTAPKAQSGEAGKQVLLSGGNPQIAKGYGDAPVQAYIAAMPGWKRDVGRRLDALVVRTVPDVHKAVKWNSPFYGIEGQGWFLSFHCFTKYVKA